MSTEQSDAAPAYRYEATVKLIIAADGLDVAWRIAKAAAQFAEAVEGVDSANSPMVEIRYSPGATGKARCHS